jgi:diguanylate cyclase (GGDEF)-like protein
MSNLFLYGIKRRKSPGVFAFSLLMLAMTIHSTGYAMELLSDTLNGMYFWIRVEYLGVSFYPFLIILFVSEYVDEKKIANKYALTFILTMNLVTLFLVYTNSYHWLYYSSVGVDPTPGFNILALKKGVWYMVQVALLYISIFYSMVTLIMKIWHAKGDYKKKIVFALVGVCIPMVTLLIYMLGLGPIYVDLTPLSYLFMVICIIIGLLRYDALALTPITYEMVFHAIGEAVLVVDRNKHVINCNNAAKELFPSLVRIKIGEYIESVEELREYDFESSPKTYRTQGKIISMKVNHIKKDRVIIYVMNDITESEQAKEQLRILAMNDALTGLYNRRYFMELMENEWCDGIIAMLDIDFFKTINDTYGHLEGDRVLSCFGNMIRQFFPQEPSCRYGGEEFVIFMKNIDISEAYERIEVIRKSMSQTDLMLGITYSAGLAEYRNGKVSEALQYADKKLYEAKDNGRNQTRY